MFFIMKKSIFVASFKSEKPRGYSSIPKTWHAVSKPPLQKLTTMKKSFILFDLLCALVQSAWGQVINGHIVDVVGREIYDGELIIKGDKIVNIKRHKLDDSKTWPYLLPGFIDSHVHIESTMLVPSQYALVAVSNGTIGVIADAHEIGNVLGVEGVDFMIQNGREATFNFLFGAPSCVPALGGDFETSGAIITADDIERMMKRDDIAFLTEMMNYPGVLSGDQEVMRKIHATLAAGKPVDGHAPALTFKELQQYAAAGITTNHECSTLDEGRANIKAGIKVIIRDGSAAKDYDNLKPLISEHPESVMFCSDDVTPDDLIHGQIDTIVKRALSDGYGLWDILQAACVNPQKHYNVNWGLLQKGDPATFIVLNSLTPHFQVESTFIRGQKVYSRNQPQTANVSLSSYPNNFAAKAITTADIALNMEPGDTMHIIHATDGCLQTGHEEIVVTGKPMTNSLYPWTEVQKIVVLNRYKAGAKPVVGLIRGFDIKNGAIASSVAHDCHNIVAIGSDDESIVRAINRIIELQGGLVAVSPNDMLDLPLPIAGLMSPLSCNEIVPRSIQLHEMARAIGCSMHSPFVTMAFMCLSVIPDLKITDRCLMDTKNMRVIKRK